MRGMRLLRWKHGAVSAAVVGAICALIAVAAQAATATVRPRLVSTTVQQFKTERGMQVVVDFKVTKADSILPAKAVICVKGVCKTDVILKTSRPAAGAVATEYTPNVLFKFGDLHQDVTVKTTLVLGTHRYTYSSKAKDELSPCVVGRGAGSGLLPDC